MGSAGTWTVTGKSAPQEVLLAAEKFGLDLKDHATYMLDAELIAGSRFDPGYGAWT